VRRGQRCGDRVDQHERRAQLAETRRVSSIVQNDGRDGNAAPSQSREHVPVVEVATGAPRRIAGGDDARRQA